MTRLDLPAIDRAVDALASQPPDRQQYRQLVARIRSLVRERLPIEATVLTISRGDTALVDFDRPRAGHFPQNEHGTYAGHHPADSTSAITHLEVLRGQGADFLVVPATAFWWFTCYKRFRRHLEQRYPIIVRQDDTCVIFALQPDDHQPAAGDGGYHALVCEIRDVVDAVLPRGTVVAVVSNGDGALTELGDRTAWHVPQDERGVYAGYHPDDESAVANIEAVRARGARFLVVPSTSGWWLTHYTGLARHLATRGRLVTHQPHVCTIYALDGGWWVVGGSG